MQTKTTLQKFTLAFTKSLLILVLFFAASNVTGQTVSSLVGTNYLGNYSLNNPAALVQTFAVKNSNATPRILSTVTMQMAPYFGNTGPSVISLYYSSTSLSGPPSIVAPDWTLIATGNVTVPDVLTDVTVLTGLTFSMPANSEYRFAIEATKGLAFSVTPTPTPNVFTIGGISLEVGNYQIAGQGIGWAGLFPTPGVMNTPTFFGGSVSFGTGAVCTGTPAPGNTVSSATTVCPATTFVLSTENFTDGSGVTYQWQSSPDNTTWTDIPGATGATLITTLTADTYFRLNVTCSGNTGTSTPIQVLATPSGQCYCIPDATDCTDEDIITNVTLGPLNNESDCGADGYTNYTADPSVMIPDLIQGNPTPISVTAGGGTFDEVVAAWIDYDHSGAFEASEFTLIGGTTGGTLTTNITPPANAVLGLTRMRVRVRFFADLTGTDACSTYIYGETEDYTVNITPCIAAAFTSQPADVTTVCPGTATFTAGISDGTAVTYQWQEQANSNAPWVNLIDGAGVSGATTPSLTVSNVSSDLNGARFRVIINGACTGTDFSSPATLTVNPLVIAVNPASYSTCAPITAPVLLAISTVFGSASNSTFTYSSGPLTLDIPDNDVAGITSSITVPPAPAGAVLTGASVNLNITHTFDGDLVIALQAPNGNILNLDAYLTASFGDVTTGFVNTLISSAGTDPLSSGADPYTGTFAPDAYTAAPPGAALPNTGPTSLGDATVSSFSDLYSVPDGDWTLGIFDGGPADTGTLDSFDLNLTYTIGTFQPYTGIWSPATGLFLDAAGTIPYVAGTQEDTVYAAPAVTTFYTVTVSNATCPSDAVVVPVRILNPDPVVAITVAPYTSLYPGLVTVATANLTPSATSGTTYQWLTNGVAIPGATSPTYQANIDAIGELSVEVSDSTFCSGTVSGSVTLKDSLTSTLFIYPNPSTGLFQVRYDNGVNDVLYGGRTLTAYDSKGARVFSKNYTVTSIYQRMDVDLSKQPKGIYIVELTDASGRTLKAERVIIR